MVQPYKKVVAVKEIRWLQSHEFLSNDHPSHFATTELTELSIKHFSFEEQLSNDRVNSIEDLFYQQLFPVAAAAATVAAQTVES
ncbi:hypothetical protein TYRP_003343 [Tyrophagus putrescentiae]|nr:hypothetical protein TYRP_003343 [Tyrophagus putrescentiae]